MTVRLHQEDIDAINELLFANNRIGAIKHYRQVAGGGLLEAKEFIEDLEHSLRAQMPEAFQPGRPGASIRVVLALAVIVVGLAVGAMVLALR